MARLLRIYQGEDQTPVTDITDMVEWPDCEFGQKAYNGEGSLSTLRFRDEDGRTGSSTGLPSGLTPLSIAAHNVVTWTEGSNTMFRGRVSPKDYTRGEQVVGRAREVDISLDDYNKDLHNIVVHDWARSAETDVARVQALAAAYLAGSPRVTTNLSTTYVNAGSNTVALPAFTYDRSSVHEVLTEIAKASGKNFFVTIDGQLFYDGNDSAAYLCPYKISDRHDEQNGTTIFAPIWDLGPASTEDGQQLLSGIWYFYSENQYVHVTSPTIANTYSWWEDIIYDDTVQTASAATQKANAILEKRKYEERTYQVSIGPLSRAQWGSIKAGQTIQIKARAIPDADDAFVTRRISELRWTAPEPETLFAHMTLDRPVKNQPYGQGKRPDTIAQPAPPINPDTPGTPVWFWTWTTTNFDDGTGTVSGGLKRPTTNPYYPVADAAFGAQAYGYNTAGNRATQKATISGSTPYTFSMDILWQYINSNARNVTLQWFGTGGTVLLSTDTWITDTGHATNVKYAEADTFTSPAGADRVVIDFSPFAGVYGDNLYISTAGISADNNPYGMADSGTSPFFARSDDPRFDQDDQHLTTATSQRTVNNSGVTLSAGDVVVPDTSVDGPAVTRTTTASTTAGPVGIVQVGGAAAANVVVQWAGVGSFVNTNGTPADGDYLTTSTTAGVANVSATRSQGAFGRVVRDDGAGETLSVLLWGVPDASSAGVGSGTALGYYFPEDYGAVGDGTTNDLTAINDCIADMIATRGTGTVFFSAPKYAIAGGVINIHPGSAQDGIHLQGAQENSLGDIAGTVIVQLTNNTGGIDINTNAYQTSFSNIGVSGPATHSSGIGIKTVRQIVPHNLTVQHFNIGIELGSSSYYTGGTRAMVYDCNIGVRFVDGSNNSDLYGWRITTCGVGWQVEGHEKFAAFGGVVEACPIGIDIDSGSNTTGGVTLAGIYFENPAGSTDIRIGNTTLVRGVVISGCKFTAHTTGFHIDAKNVDGLVIFANDFRKTTGTAIRTQAPATGVVTGPNHYSGATDSLSGNARIIDPETDVTPGTIAAAASAGTSRYWMRADAILARGTTPANTVSITDTGAYYTGTDVEAALQEIGAGGIGGGTSGTGNDHAHIVDELFSGDGATTVFSLANEAVTETAMAYVAGVRTPVTVGGAMNDEVTFAAAPGSGTDNVSLDYVAVSA